MSWYFCNSIIFFRRPSAAKLARGSQHVELCIWKRGSAAVRISLSRSGLALESWRQVTMPSAFRSWLDLGADTFHELQMVRFETVQFVFVDLVRFPGF